MADKEKKVKIMTMYGEEMEVKIKYVGLLERLAKNEQIVPRMNEYGIVTRYLHKPDFYSKRTGIYGYVPVDIKGKVTQWSSLTKEQQDAIGDYMQYKMAEARGWKMEDTERNIRRKEEVEKILNVKL